MVLFVVSRFHSPWNPIKIDNMDNELEFSDQAFCKMILHAMKYPHSVCSGLLLSPKLKEENNKEDEEGGDGDNTTRIIEAIPISHASHCLAPNIEIAFNSVRVFAQQQELVISGYYQTDRFNETSCPDTFSQRVTEKICETYPNAVLCFVNFEGMLAETFLDPHQLIDGKWRRKLPHTFRVESNTELIAENILYSKERLYRKIVDFDDHFNNISLDWTNASISQRVDYLIANVC